MYSFPGKVLSLTQRRALNVATVLALAVCAFLVLYPSGFVRGSNPSPVQVDTTASRLDSALFRTATGAFDTSSARRIARQDSLRKDSLNTWTRKLIVDTTYVVDHDSTARLKNFTYVRRDPVEVQVFPARTYPLFGTPRLSSYRREVVIDSLTSMMEFRETVGGVDVKEPVGIPLQDYVASRLKRGFHRLLAEEARKPKALVAKNDLGELLSTITQITIPIPANPIFSVFGKQEIKLNISGSVDIKAGFRNTKSDQATISNLDQSRSEPDFNQDVQVNVNGMVGDKLSILADWNTKRTFEYENQLKIKYTGYDDEIVQSVEAGNVSLSTPSSFIGSSQALFGVKAKFQMGPLTLTTLASQKKGQIKEVAVSGGAKEQTFAMKAYEYATNHFFVDTSYINKYEDYYNSEPPLVTGGVQIVEEEVWVQRQGAIPDPNERQAIAYINLPPRGPGGYSESFRTSTDLIDGQIETGPFVRLDRTQYDLDGDGYLGVLSLNANVGDQLIVAIAYRQANGTTQYGELVRNVGSDSTAAGKRLILKMVKPKNLLTVGPSYATAWKMLLKNIYPIQGIGRNLKKDGFTLDIFRGVPGGQDVNNVLNEPLLRAFYLDRYTGDTPGADGQFDFRPGRTINLGRAEIIFPKLRPFDTGLKAYFGSKNIAFPDSSYFYKDIYDTTQTFAQQSLNNRYTISGKAAGEATSKYSLGFNVVEGSVQVLLDGRQLISNIDYTVDYIIGEVVIKNDKALVPGANLQIKYEQNDLFQLASKTLLGARADLALSPTTNLGFTIMNLNQQTLSDKVRLGEEPNNNTIIGIDGATSVNLPFLTKAIDALPLLHTKEPSQLKVSGEVAYMMPNPNTKASTIASDNGEGIAYIDDFEGARRSIPVGIAYNAWTQASPLADDSLFPGLFVGIPDTTKMFAKGKMIWFNRLPTDVHLTDVYPRKKPGNAANDQTTVLDLRYFPTTRGMYNYSLNPASTLTRNHNWGGIMKPLSVSAINLSKENVNFIELWMRVDKAPLDKSARMVIDLGSISEDAVPNRVLNSEDLVLPGSVPNGTLQEGEDVGLDMLSDPQEQAIYPTLGGDPSGDDYAFDNSTVGGPGEDFTHINGTEGNKNGPGGLIPDTEDLNSNGIVDLGNSYFEYILPLDTSIARNPNVVSYAVRDADGSRTGWVQFRIPIRDYVHKVGTPSPENIEFVRVSFVNATDTIAVRIADFSLVGNQWQKLQTALQDSSYDVTVVSVEDNFDYVSPPGVIRERDLTRPDENVQANEQSLAIKLKNLADGESRQAVKFYTYKALDLFSYRTMKMFVHTDDKFQYVDEHNYDAQIFFRFGLDSLNFYEYRAPLRRDPANGNWTEIAINFADLTAIKAGRDSVNLISRPRAVSGGPPGAVYRVLGNPSLTQVVYMALGVENPLGIGTPLPLTGSVWFDELRLTSVDNSSGGAYRVSTELKLADLGSVAFNYSMVDPNFHTLEQRFGSRQTSTNWGLNASFSLEKFFSEDWAGTSLPVSYSHTEALVKPKYLPNSDILVSEAADLTKASVLTNGGSQADAVTAADAVAFNAETRRVTDTYAAPAFRINIPSSAWYVRDTFNKLSFGFTYTKSNDRSPAVEKHTSWSWNARIGYTIVFPPDTYVMPFKNLFSGIWFFDDYKDLRIFLPITNFNWSFSAVRSRDNSLQRTEGAQEIISRSFTASRQFGFGWKSTEGGLLSPSGDYSLSVESTLLGLELNRFNQQRSFAQIFGDMFFGQKVVNFGDDTRYSQRNQLNTKPVIPNIFNIKKYLDLTFSYGVDYSWQNTLTSGDLGKSAGFNNNINVSLNFRLKQLFDPLFEDAAGSQPSAPVPQGGRGSRSSETGAPARTDSGSVADSSRSRPAGVNKTIAQLKTLAKTFLKIPFLDYDNVNFSFTQTNSEQNSGVVGRPGFVNFWGRIPFFQGSLPEYGPSRLYQLGLISDPSGKLTNFGFRSKFPFFGWDVDPGVRAPGGTLVNSFRQSNRLGAKTSRALWEGAHLDLSWNVGWTFNRTQNVSTEFSSLPTITNSTTTGSVDRSFLTFPDVLFLGMFKTSLKEVSKRYGELKANGDSSKSDDEKLAQAFEDGFEALPFLRKVFGPFYPRINWSLRWDGLEKLPLFAKFVSRLSLDHAYNSNYTRQYENSPGGGGERTDGQRVAYGFAPLVGLNFTFKELLKGSFGANLRYNTSTSYDLATSSRNIVETLTQEFSLTASYARKGFEIPFFGLALNNDVDLSTSYSVSKNSRKTYDVSRLDVDITGVPLEGSTRTTLEPRIKYVLSLRVTASVYYRYTKIAPDDSGSRIPGSTTNEAGLDIHIAIQ